MSTFSYDPVSGLPRRGRRSNQDAFMRGLGNVPSFGGDVFERTAASRPGGGGYGGPGIGGFGPITIPGFTPDYKSLIEQALAPLRAQFAAEGVSDTASANAALTRGLVQFGQPFTLDSASQAFGADLVRQSGLANLLAEANPLAEKNTQAGLSISARQQKAFADQIRDIRNRLAARGALRSGELGYQLQEAQQGRDIGQYDARQAITDYFTSVEQGRQQAERERQRQLIAAQGPEAERQARLNPATGSQEAAFDHTDAQGNPVYRTSDGRLVNADGSPYTPPASPPPAPPPPGLPPIGRTPDPVLGNVFDPIPSRPAQNVVAGRPLRFL